MSKTQTLRGLVNARLTAAADEIFALFEATIAEFEEELRRSKEREKQSKQQLLDLLNPKVVLLRANQRSHESPEPGLNQGLNRGLNQGLNQRSELGPDQRLDFGLNQDLDLEIVESPPQIKEEEPEEKFVKVEEEEEDLVQVFSQDSSDVL
ncbi:hypothetical protein WMY93_027246 [Mugilogobius chulae]|uniref:Uncharacterized protein n=1 Tax=Mugilogobius chulae TaxID=88201 RepID=A0AAW0MSD8_9GOBI